jgi:hypothetical protein
VPPDEPKHSPAEPAPDDVAEAGQEEVFSKTALEHGLIKDPKALDPAALGTDAPASD